jgi:hypothetical protein
MRLFTVVLGLSLAAVCAGSNPFIRGDSNADGTVNLADGIYILQRLFASGPAVTCLDAGDANDDEGLNLADAIYIFQNLFANGPSPPAPYPDCGEDPGGDTLDCVLYNEIRCPPLLPPECFSEAQVGDIVNQYLGQPICLPSPAYEDTLDLGLFTVDVTACPAGCPRCTCTGGDPGCEVTIDQLDADIDFLGGTIATDLTASADDFTVDLDTTRCVADVTITGSVAGTFTLVPLVDWEGISEITAIGPLVFTVTDVDVDIVDSGGFYCTALQAASGELKQPIQDALNENAEDFRQDLEAELLGMYVCP